MEVKKERTFGVAQYLDSLYMQEHDGEHIDELRLHKLMYFAQKQCLKERKTALFGGLIEGWRFGPVVVPVHGALKENRLYKKTYEISDGAKKLLDQIYAKYKDISSMELNNLSHEEFSWMKSRDGKKPEDSSNAVISVADIDVDIMIELLDERMGDVDYELYI